jgi:vacuolar-type H+-ATPase subunit H
MSQSEEKMYDLIDRLNQLWETGFHILPGHLIVVKSQELSRIISSFPSAIPAEINEAHIILRKKEDILQEARIKADRIIADAENDRHRLLSESSIMRDIEEKATKFKQDVIEECESIKMRTFNEAEGTRLAANEEAIKIKDGAQAYAQNVLNKLESDLNQLYQIVMNGQQYLADVKNSDTANRY